MSYTGKIQNMFSIYQYQPSIVSYLLYLIKLYNSLNCSSAVSTIQQISSLLYLVPFTIAQGNLRSRVGAGQNLMLHQKNLTNLLKDYLKKGKEICRTQLSLKAFIDKLNTHSQLELLTHTTPRYSHACFVSGRVFEAADQPLKLPLSCLRNRRAHFNAVHPSLYKRLSN